MLRKGNMLFEVSSTLIFIFNSAHKEHLILLRALEADAEELKRTEGKIHIHLSNRLAVLLSPLSCPHECGVPPANFPLLSQCFISLQSKKKEKKTSHTKGKWEKILSE